MSALPDDWRSWPPEAKARLRWRLQARPEQLPPDDPDWLIWLLLAGRGFGKTRSGAEWLTDQARLMPASRWAIVVPTFTDGRDTCVEGESGLLACVDGQVRTWNRSMGELEWMNGSQAKIFSSEEPDRLRGPQHHGFWGDELAAWRNLQGTWDMLMFGLRLGPRPRGCVTTTPKPLHLLRDLVERPSTRVTRGSTYDNLANLAPTFRQQILDRYEGTTLGRQELHGEILEDVDGALWTRTLIDAARVWAEPQDADGHLDLARIVVAVDPAVTSGEASDETGIVVAGTNTDTPAEAFVLEDRSGRYTPDGWARVAVDAYREWNADRIIGETNNGGDLVEHTLRTVRGGPDVPYRKVTATRGKRRRAEPIVALYEQQRVHHVGAHDLLEDQMCQWVDGVDWSPDRMDALVWALTELVVDGPRVPEGRLYA